MTSRRRWALLGGAAVVALVVCGCSTPGPLSPPPPTAPPRSLPSPQEAALETYREYWVVSDAARAAPRQRNWQPQLEAVAQDQALEAALRDVENYASIPARTVGDIERSPVVADATADTVTLVDCIDVSRSNVVTEPDGRSLIDQQNRVTRFRLHAVVIRDEDRWVVEQAVPALEEPC